MSNKTSYRAWRALQNGKPKTISRNTQVTKDEVLLWGNRIISKINDTTYEINTCGWHTRTTKDRLGAIPGVYVSSRRGRLYLRYEFLPGIFREEEWDGRSKIINIWQ